MAALLALTAAFAFSASHISPLCDAFVQELNLLRFRRRDKKHEHLCSVIEHMKLGFKWHGSLLEPKSVGSCVYLVAIGLAALYFER